MSSTMRCGGCSEDLDEDVGKIHRITCNANGIASVIKNAPTAEIVED